MDLLALLALFPFPSLGNTGSEEDYALLEIVAPETLAGVAFKDEDGKQNLTVHDSQLVVLHLWATWCPPCISEISDVDAIQRMYGERGIKIVAVSLDGTLDKVKQFFSDRNITSIKPYLDSGGATLQATRAPGLPVTYFINRKMEIVARAEGPLDWNSTPVRDFIEQFSSAAVATKPAQP